MASHNSCMGKHHHGSYIFAAERITACSPLDKLVLSRLDPWNQYLVPLALTMALMKHGSKQ